MLKLTFKITLILIQTFLISNLCCGAVISFAENDCLAPSIKISNNQFSKIITKAISSDGDEVLGDFDAMLIEKFAKELEANKLADGEFDFRTALRQYEKILSNSMIRKLTPFLEPFRKKVITTVMGDIIVIIKPNKRYLILSSKKDDNTGDRELIFIDSNFRQDRIWKRKNKVYARNIAAAIRELTKLRLWKALEKELMVSSGINNIQEWTKENIAKSAVLDVYFHQIGIEMEYTFKTDVIVNIEKNSQDKIVSKNLLEYLKCTIPMAVKNNYKRQFSLEEELAKYPVNPVSFKKMLSIFNNSSAGEKVRLKKCPTPDQLNKLSNTVSFEVEIFQRKSTGEWFAIKGYNEDVDPEFYSDSIGSNTISFGKNSPRIVCILDIILSAMGDMSYHYHSHPKALSKFLAPPSAADFIFILANKSGRKVAAVGDKSYVYIYSVVNPALTQVVFPELLAKLNKKWSKIKSLEGENGALSNNADNIIFTEWKKCVEELGFGLERFTWAEFKQRKEEIFGKFADNSPFESATMSLSSSQETLGAFSGNLSQTSHIEQAI